MRAAIAVFLVFAGGMAAADLKLTDGRILNEARVIAIEDKTAIIQHAGVIEGIPLTQIPRGALAALPAGPAPTSAAAALTLPAADAEAKVPTKADAIKVLAVDADLTVVRVLPGGVVAKGEGYVGPTRKVGDRMERERASLGELFFVKLARKTAAGETLKVRMWLVAERQAYVNHKGALIQLATYITDPAGLPKKAE